ncbi:alpha/beta hydrolase domain-containing protein [Salinactinospora qingdaonensis]|uniref:Alpha/beta hydrolase domain-containing protein n=1 Tax=Salinactinospora qingdaonensis TaxID=702744 RepID=A0ABP7FTH9_9ACTN
MSATSHRLGTVAALMGASLALLAPMAAAAPTDDPSPVPVPEVEGPLPGTAPGDPASDNIEDTYPFYATDVDLDSYDYVEEEFIVSGTANQYVDGAVASEHPYRTRVIVRRPEHQWDSNGTALVEWQNVSAGYDIDALWSPSSEHIMREGYTWVGVSAQNVGVSYLTEWSPARYGDLDVTDGGTVENDQLSYDIFSQTAQELREPDSALAGGIELDQLLAIGASQSAGRMTAYYDRILPHIEPVFDGYGFIVGSAPTTERPEPAFQVLSETDLTLFPAQGIADSVHTWEVAGTAHSGWGGRAAREGVDNRDLPGGQPQYNCAQPPFSRVPLHHVLNASYNHLSEWAEDGTAPPEADPIERTEDGEIARDEDGHALGGIRLSQVEVPTALNTGVNSATIPSDFFCVLFGSHEPYSDAELAQRYDSHASYVFQVKRVERRNVLAGYVTLADSLRNRFDAVRSDVAR